MVILRYCKFKNCTLCLHHEFWITVLQIHFSKS